MANNNAYSDDILLKDVRLLWADIYKPGKGMNGGPPKFKVAVTFPPDSDAHKAVRAAMSKTALELWGPNAGAVVNAMADNNKALRDGNKKLDDKGNVKPEYAGQFWVSASRGQDDPPLIIAQKSVNGKMVEIGEDGQAYQNGALMNPQPYKITKPYRGCYVNIKVVFIASKGGTVKKDGGAEVTIPNQIYARFEAIQFVRDGEAFGRGPASAEGFEDVEVEGDDGQPATTATTGAAADLF